MHEDDPRFYPTPHPPTVFELLFESLFGVGGFLLIGLQIACVIHAIRTGRPYWWIWIIFIAPGIGSAAYLFFEVRPSLRRWNWKAIAWRLKSAAERIRIREAIVQDSPTQAHRLQLVDELAAVGRWERGREVLEAGLQGVFAGDAELLLRLIDCQLELGQTKEAAASLAKMEEVRDRSLILRRRTAEARVAGANGRDAEAESLFAELLKQDRSEAPRFYFGRFLIEANRKDEGRAVLKDLITRYRKATPVWRGQEREWYRASRKLLAATR